MDETKAKLESRRGSFLPEIVPIRKPWCRNRELERHIIERQMRECEQLAHYLDGLAHLSIKEDVSVTFSGSTHFNNGKKAFLFHMDALLELYVKKKKQG